MGLRVPGGRLREGLAPKPGNLLPGESVRTQWGQTVWGSLSPESCCCWSGGGAGGHQGGDAGDAVVVVVVGVLGLG